MPGTRSGTSVWGGVSRRASPARWQIRNSPTVSYDVGPLRQETFTQEGTEKAGSTGHKNPGSVLKHLEFPCRRRLYPLPCRLKRSRRPTSPDLDQTVQITGMPIRLVNPEVI